ncbi:CopD family protein [Sulfitobacter sp.]|uniref:CopD family protein n=1 Tax=Sulfitobacter sp. TaxID=1903071 RepID=UPI003F6D309F
MINALVGADTLTWVAIVVKALVYATSLSAAGGILSAVALRSLPQGERAWVIRLAVICAVAAALLSLARLPLRASFLMGGTWQGAFDPMILPMVAQSPLGMSIAIRLVGLALVPAILIPGRIGPALATTGALIIAMSFTFRGHALADPRVILGLLLAVHLVAIAFWIGAFAPLYRLADQNGLAAGKVAHDFGRLALWGVGALAVSGSVTLWLLTKDLIAALGTAYGQMFALKLAAFTALIGLAAFNKLRLTPALLRQDPDAAQRLRRSIVLEVALVALILLTTATLTTISAPLMVEVR